MQYIITKEQIDAQVKHLHRYHIDNSASGQLAIDAAIAMLQSLPVLEGEPVGIVVYKPKMLRVGVLNTAGMVLPDATKLYTHPAPFTPVTADMVTDEMLKKYDKLCYDEVSTPQQHLAAVLNLRVKK